jgi:hypothetical protein
MRERERYFSNSTKEFVKGEVCFFFMFKKKKKRKINNPLCHVFVLSICPPPQAPAFFFLMLVNSLAAQEVHIPAEML